MAIAPVTTNYKLKKPRFDESPWHDDVNGNFDKIDALFKAVGLVNITGAWENSAIYAVGNRLFDDTDGTLWIANVAHTSAATGTFAADRVANPTYWSVIDTALVSRGAYVAGTQYFAGDLYYSTTEFLTAVVLADHVGAANPRTDATAGRTVLITDNKAAVTAANLSETNAAASASAANVSAIASDASADAAALSGIAAEADRAAAAASASTATTQAGIATTQAGNAVTSATTATTQAGIATTKAGEANTSAVASAASAAASDASADAALISENNAAASVVGAVKYNVVQTPTAAEQGQARANIGADLLGGFRNKVINPRLDIWQRGVSFAMPAAVFGYTADRMASYSGIGGVATVTQQAFAVGTQEVIPGRPEYFLRYARTTAATAGGYALGHKLENVRLYSAKRWTWSFWAKVPVGSGIGLLAPQIARNWGSGGTTTDIETKAALNITSVWARYDVIVDVPTEAGKSITQGNHLGLYLLTPTGTTFTVDIAMMSFVEGDATAEINPTGQRHIQQEEALCDRYFQRMGSGTASNRLGVGQAAGTTEGIIDIILRGSMRSAPTLLAVGAFSLTNAAGAVLAVTSITGANLNKNLAGLTVGVATGLTAGNATLFLANGTGVLFFDAEL